MPAVERDRALATADRVTAASQRWLADHARQFVLCQEPVGLAACVATHSLATVLALPTLPVPDLTTLTCVRLWAYALTEHAGTEDLCADALPALRRRLSRRPLFTVFGKQWYAAMRDALAAAATTRGWRASGYVPTWEEYLETAGTAVALRPYALGACMVAESPDSWAELARLEPMVHAAARCLLLTADLDRHARTPGDCGLTAAVLVQHALVAQGAAEGTALNQARAHLRAKCAVDLAFLRTQAQVAPPGRSGLAHALYAYTTFVCQYAELPHHAGLVAA